MEAAVGARILSETDEMSLEEALDTLRMPAADSANKGLLKTTHIDELNEINSRHFRATQVPTLAICGRHLALVYKLANSLITSPHRYSLLVIDVEGCFDATHLSCGDSDARHIYVHRPARTASCDPRVTDEGDKFNELQEAHFNLDWVRSLVAEASDFMLYDEGAALSVSRRWWGTIVLGGPGAGDLVAGWKGWLRVSKESVNSFSFGLSAEEALTKRARRDDAVNAVGWVAESPWGSLAFTEGG